MKTLKDDHCPSPGVVEIRVSMLAEVNSRRSLSHVSRAPIAVKITASGGNNIKKTSKEISMPSDAEELRDRLHIWGALSLSVEACVG